MHHLTTTHAARWNQFHGLTGTGHVRQDPDGVFPVEDDNHDFTVSRYILRNAVRAGLVARAEDWPYSSLLARHYPTEFSSLLSDSRLPYPPDWLEIVNRPQTEAEREALRRCVNRGQPLGGGDWRAPAIGQVELEHSVRAPGRPRPSARP